MSEEQRITNVEKEKDPRRVAAGRRLGAISKAAKERKALEREYACADNSESLDGCDAKSGGLDRTSIIAVAGVAIAGVCLYYTYKQDKRASVTEGPNEDPPKRTTTTTKPPGSRIRSLD